MFLLPATLAKAATAPRSWASSDVLAAWASSRNTTMSLSAVFGSGSTTCDTVQQCHRQHEARLTARRHCEAGCNVCRLPGEAHTRPFVWLQMISVHSCGTDEHAIDELLCLAEHARVRSCSIHALCTALTRYTAGMHRFGLQTCLAPHGISSSSHHFVARL